MADYSKLVVPITRLPINEEDGVIGSGLISFINGEAYLVTCKHNLHPDKPSAFRLNGVWVTIDECAPNLITSPGEEIRSILKPQSDDRPWSGPYEKEDYLFYTLPESEIKHAVEFVSTVGVLESDNLVYVGYDPEAGDLLNIPCRRAVNNQEWISKRDNDGIGKDFINQIHIVLENSLPGYSGGGVFIAGSNKCIGMLTSGAANLISIIKGQTMAEKLHELKGA